MEKYYLIFITLIFFCGIMVIFSINPIHSIIWALLIITINSFLLLFLGYSFVSFILIVVYIGAITILFLFVIMMIDEIKLYFMSSVKSYIWILTLTLINVFINIKLSLNSWNSSNSIDLAVKSLDSKRSIEILSKLIYAEYLYCFILVTFILLIGLIASILIALQVNPLTKKQVLFKQHSRTKNF